jgi:uncharacterized membrane protein
MAENWSGIIAAFLASFVEFVEALTLVLAAATVRGFRPALSGAVAGVCVLGILLIIFGPHLSQINGPTFHLVVGVLMLLFGLRWLKKAILRSAGLIGLHDEAAIFRKKTDSLQRTPEDKAEAGAFLTAFNGVFIEGVEVIFIILAVGSTTRNMIPPIIGASVAAFCVVLLGVAARKPLTQIPENALKFVVGALISSFGTFWTGEGLKITWLASDFALIYLSLGYAAAAYCAVIACRGLKVERTA